MTPADLQRFCDGYYLGRRDRFGADLQITQWRLRRFLSGEQPIPRHIALAVTALLWDLPLWPEDAPE